MAHTAIITAGGTTESIDDVRLVAMYRLLGGADLAQLTEVEIANISGGKFGLLIAEAFVAAGIETTLIGKRELIRSIETEDPLLRPVPFRSAQDLDVAIKSEVRRKTPDFFLMAAAVSDYSPVAFEGKLSSDADELVLRLKRNPKLLDTLRQQVGNDCTLVGFKLVSGLESAQLIEIAKRQNERAHLDFTVGNDMKQIDFDNGIHPVSVVDQDGAVTDLSGKRPLVAGKLVDHLVDYHAAKHSH